MHFIYNPDNPYQKQQLSILEFIEHPLNVIMVSIKTSRRNITHEEQAALQMPARSIFLTAVLGEVPLVSMKNWKRYRLVVQVKRSSSVKSDPSLLTDNFSSQTLS